MTQGIHSAMSLPDTRVGNRLCPTKTMKLMPASSCPAPAFLPLRPNCLAGNAVSYQYTLTQQRKL